MKIYKKKAGVTLSSLPAFAEASAEELRVLLLFWEKETLSAEEIASLLSLPVGEAKDALAFWRGGGALTGATAKEKAAPEEKKATDAKRALLAQVEALKNRPVPSADVLPVYPEGELAKAIEEGDLSSFIAECQAIHRKQYSPGDINTVVALHKELHLPTDYICLLIAYCKSAVHCDTQEAEGANGEEKKSKKREKQKLPMRYVETTAFDLFDRGITTTDALTAYIERRTRYGEAEKFIRETFGLKDRRLAAFEEEIIERWFGAYGYNRAVILAAYEAAAASTSNITLKYTDGIVTRWNKAGCKNIADVHALIEKEKTERSAAKTAAAGGKKGLSAAAIKEKEDMRSLEVDDFFAKALTRSYDSVKPDSE